MKLRCPVCHASFTVESLCQDDAGRELLGIVARLPPHIGGPVVGYVGLFRAASRDLANDRALRLLNEALALTVDTERLALACAQVVENMRKKQVEAAGLACPETNKPCPFHPQSTWKPLSNHNYLKKVLSDTTFCAPAAQIAGGQAIAAQSKTSAGVAGFQRRRRDGN